MSSAHTSPNMVRALRLARGWSQQELADRAGLSRAGVSAIEAERLSPSVTAALALSKAFGRTVEELFAPHSDEDPPEWAFLPATPQPRYWHAQVENRMLAYPIEDDAVQFDWHDGVFRSGAPMDVDLGVAESTLVLAGCDPAAGLLAAEYARQFQFRMIVLRRSSRAALELLAAGKAHAAGIHLADAGQRAGNLRAARSRLGKDCELVRVARWEEGIAVAPRLRDATMRDLVQSKAHWIGREEGSGARQCQDEILEGRPAPRRVALDHRMVAAAIKCGWADVGPCVRLASEEAGLRFVKVTEKGYDICFQSAAEADPRIAALLATLRSRSYRSRLADLPGYSTDETGELLS